MNPVGGSRVANLGVARQALEFEPVVPEGVGDLRSVWIAQIRPRTGKAILLGLVYSSSHLGIVDVVQSVPSTQGDDWVEYARHVAAESRLTEDDPGSLGSAELVHVGGSVPALLTMSEDEMHAGIMWLQGEVKLHIFGPSLRRADVVALANRIERGGL